MVVFLPFSPSVSLASALFFPRCFFTELSWSSSNCCVGFPSSPNLRFVRHRRNPISCSAKYVAPCRSFAPSLPVSCLIFAFSSRFTGSTLTELDVKLKHCNKSNLDDTMTCAPCFIPTKYVSVRLAIFSPCHFSRSHFPFPFKSFLFLIITTSTMACNGRAIIMATPATCSVLYQHGVNANEGQVARTCISAPALTFSPKSFCHVIALYDVGVFCEYTC